MRNLTFIYFFWSEKLKNTKYTLVFNFSDQTKTIKMQNSDKKAAEYIYCEKQTSTNNYFSSRLSFSELTETLVVT